MKKIVYSLIIMLGVMACEETIQKPEQDVDKLLGAWAYGTTGYIKRDGVDITSDFAGLSIVFQDGKIVVSNGGKLFPVSQDIWTYTKLDKTRILRVSDNLEMDVEVTEDVLFLHFSYQYTIIVSGGRVSTISGNYEIKLQRV